jgi:hypothetical protein
LKTNKFRFWARKAFDWTPWSVLFWAQHKILHQIKPKNNKIGQYFMWRRKRSQKFVWELPDGISFWGQKSKLNPARPMLSNPKGEVSNLKASFKNQADKIFIWQSDGIFFSRKNRFSPIKSHNSSKKLDITKSVLYIEFFHRK